MTPPETAQPPAPRVTCAADTPNACRPVSPIAPPDPRCLTKDFSIPPFRTPDLAPEPRAPILARRTQHRVTMTGALQPSPAKATPADFPVTLTDDPTSDRPLRGPLLFLGDFDGFHPGHRTPVRQSRKAARGRPVAPVSCNPHPRSLTAGLRPLPPCPPRMRARLLALRGIDFIFSPRFNTTFTSLSPKSSVKGVPVDAQACRPTSPAPVSASGACGPGLFTDLRPRRGLSVGCTTQVTPDNSPPPASPLGRPTTGAAAARPARIAALSRSGPARTPVGRRSGHPLDARKTGMAMLFRHFPASAYRSQPWRNGQGGTDEICLLPAAPTRGPSTCRSAGRRSRRRGTSRPFPVPTGRSHASRAPA